MTTQQVRIWIKDHAPSVIAVCSAVTLWAAPSVWLHGELKGLGAKVQANTVSIGKIETRLDNVEVGLQEIKRGLIRLEEKVDDLISHLLEAQP